MRKTLVCQFSKTTPKAIQYQQVDARGEPIWEMVMPICAAWNDEKKFWKGGDRMRKRRKKPPLSKEWAERRAKRERKILSAGSGLRGFSHTVLSQPAGLKGSTFGPASKGRQIVGAERDIIEQDLRRKGVIGPRWKSSADRHST
jgi:hypothetical protein